MTEVDAPPKGRNVRRQRVGRNREAYCADTTMADYAALIRSPLADGHATRIVIISPECHRLPDDTDVTTIQTNPPNLQHSFAFERTR
jgi:hypothetical protein